MTKSKISARSAHPIVEYEVYHDNRSAGPIGESVVFAYSQYSVEFTYHFKN